MNEWVNSEIMHLYLVCSMNDSISNNEDLPPNESIRVNFNNKDGRAYMLNHAFFE
jgi:hypothetical protein